MRKSILAAALALFPVYAIAGEAVTYKDGNTTLEGWWEPSACGDTKATVLIAHQWKGLGEYEKKRATMLAEECYNAFAVDIYGQGIRPETKEAAGAEASKYKKNPDLARRRMNAALQHVYTLPKVQKDKIAIIGYCFGGTMALELARSGADFNTAISFHGGLATEKKAQKGIIKPLVIVHHGGDDPHVPPKDVGAFMMEMLDADAPLNFYVYPGAVHSFTDWSAGNDKDSGAAYNQDADRLSWQRTMDVLEQRF